MIARLLLIALMGSVTVPALAQGLPAYNVSQTCIDQARRAGARDTAASADCLESENEARGHVAQLWPTLSPVARQRCARLAERRQSYLILSGCAEREATIQR